MADNNNMKRESRRDYHGRRSSGMNYSTLMHGLKLAGIDLNRKMLAEIAVSDKDAFASLAEKAKAALAK